jgi:hypothetical protein
MRRVKVTKVKVTKERLYYRERSRGIVSEIKKGGRTAKKHEEMKWQHREK